MAHHPARPLSPHLTIWKWGPHMLVSILHRATGIVLAVGGGLIFAAWLACAAAGPKEYAAFYAWVVDGQVGAQPLANILARIIGIALTWAAFQHMCSGVRHFVLDTGAGYELRANRTGARATIVISALATLLFWAVIWRAKF